LSFHFFDSLRNLVTGLGVLGKDKSVSNAYILNPLSTEQLEAAYRGDWVARKAVDIPAADLTREWRDWQADPADIGEIEDAEKKLDIQRKLKRTMIKGRLYGGGALILGVDDGQAPDQPLNLDRVKEGSLKYVHSVSAMQLTAGELEFDVNSEWFMEPKYFQFSSGLASLASISSSDLLAKIHPSRVVRFLGSEVPDLERNQSGVAGFGWGDPVIQVINDAVQAVAASTQGVATLIQEAKLDVIKLPDLAEQVSTQAYTDRLSSRMQMMATMKSLVGVTLLDKDDDWNRIQVTWAGLPDIIKLYLMIASAAVDVPATRFLAQSPAGMDATGESDTRNYYDRLRAEQNTEVTPALNRLDEVLLRSTFGTKPDGIWYEWAPLWAATDEEKSRTFLAKAQVYQIDVGAALIPDEALRQARENQLIEDGVYPGLEQALEDAEAEMAAAMGELDPEVRAQAEQQLALQKAGVPMLPPPAQPAPEGGGAPGEPAGGQSTGGAQKTNRRASPGQQDALPRDKNGTFALGMHVGKARRRGLAGYGRGRRAGSKQDQSMRHAGWVAGEALTEHGRHILAAIRQHDAEPRPLYVYRSVVNGAEIARWAKTQRIQIPDVNDLHVTILYSREAVDPIKIGEPRDGQAPPDTAKVPAGGLYIGPGGPRAIERMGPGGAAIVLQFASSALCWRHEEMIYRGASHDYEDYTPHITLNSTGANEYTDLSPPLNVPGIEPYRGEIILGPEVFKTIEINQPAGTSS